MSKTSPLEFKKQVLANSENAVAGSPPLSCSPNCQPCRRVGLMLLVVAPSVVPNEHATALKEAGYQWDSRLDAEFSALDRQATQPVARISRPGYINIYYPSRQRWDIWQIMANGLTRKIMHQVNTQQYAKLLPPFILAPEPKTCSQGAANTSAQLIHIENALQIDKVWLAYTPRLWPPMVLKRHADNPTVSISAAGSSKAIKKPLREVRGREISPQAILGGTVPNGAIPLTASHLEHHVVDFAKQPSWAFKQAFSRARRPLDKERFGLAKAFEEKVRALEKASGPPAEPTRYVEKSIILMLPDPIGVADQLNGIRLETLSQRQGWMAGGPDASGRNEDPNRPWERQSLLHAGFIREWIRDRERLGQKMLVDQNVYKTTQIISGHEYKDIQAHEKRTGKPYNPPGTTYERLPGPIEKYRVTWPQSSIQKGVEDTALSRAKGREERYNTHLRWDDIKASNQKWIAQDKGWLTLLEARDKDHVAWLNTNLHAVALRHDHIDNSPLLGSALEKDEATIHLSDSEALIEDVALCYGGAGCTEVSLKNLIELFERDPAEREQWIAEALINQFDLWEKISSLDENHGLRSDLYDSALGLRTSLENFTQGLQLAQRATAQYTAMLTQASQLAINKMQEWSSEAAQKQKFGIASSLDQIQAKRMIWVKATALHHYLQHGDRMYFLKVRWRADHFVNAVNDSLRGPAVELKFNQRSERSRHSQRSSATSTQTELKRWIDKSPHPLELTVPLVLDEAAIQAVAKRGHKVGPGMLSVVGGNLLGLPQVPLALPEEFAMNLFTEQAKTRAGMSQQLLQNLENGAMSGKALLGHLGVAHMQAWALYESVNDFTKKGGWEQWDAAASMLGGVLGVLGPPMEVAAALLQPSSLTKAGTPMAAELAMGLPKAHLRFGLAAGALGAAGSLMDATSSFAKAMGRAGRRDQDSSVAYFVSAGFHVGSFLSLAYGSFLAYRSAVLMQAMTQGTVRILAVRFGCALVAGGIASTSTGVGLWLWIAGIGVGILAAVLEDDENEIFLERSYFGRGKQAEYMRMSSTPIPKFKGLEEEVLALATLASGYRGSLEWTDNLTEDDEITLKIECVDWDPHRRAITYTLEGFETMHGKRIGELDAGELSPSSSKEIFEAEKAVPIKLKNVGAVRLTFTLWDISRRMASTETSHPDLAKDTRVQEIARDAIWIED